MLFLRSWANKNRQSGYLEINGVAVLFILKKETNMKRFSILLVSLCMLLSATAYAYEESEDVTGSNQGYGQMGTPYSAYNNDYYYGQSPDGYWRGPRVAAYASDGSVRYISRNFMNNTGYGMPGYGGAVGPYGNKYEYHRRYKRSGGLLTTLLEFLL